LNSELAWEFIIPPSHGLLTQGSGGPEPITGVKDRGKKGIKALCFVYIPIREMTDLIK